MLGIGKQLAILRLLQASSWLFISSRPICSIKLPQSTVDQHIMQDDPLSYSSIRCAACSDPLSAPKPIGKLRIRSAHPQELW